EFRYLNPKILRARRIALGRVKNVSHEQSLFPCSRFYVLRLDRHPSTDVDLSPVEEIYRMVEKMKKDIYSANVPVCLLGTFLCLLLLYPVAAFPQAANGRITGTVTDSSGAVLPGVAVEVTNTATGIAFASVSTETGAYSAPNLPPGVYSISASLPGFKKYDRSGVTLAAAQTVKVDIPLEVGAASESITITE